MSEPQTIGRYKVLRQIGSGGMSSVYLAQDPALDRLVAIKVIGADVYGDPNLRARFMREATASARLAHPNIVTIFEFGEEHGRLFIAMEHIDGVTVDKAVLKSGRRVAPILRWMDELCAGLAAAHKNGVIHRDVKPANLLVGANDILKIVDFGIARLVNSGLTEPGTILGTLNYMSPEHLKGVVIDHRADIFAVGAVFYELLVGRKAFAGDVASGVIQRILSEPAAPLGPDVNPGIAAIVFRCLEKQPGARYQDLDRMRRDLATQMFIADLRFEDAPPRQPAASTPPVPPPPAAPAAQPPPAPGPPRPSGLAPALPRSTPPARPADVLIPLLAAPSHQPSDATAGDRFVGRNTALNSLVRQVVSSAGGSFLITGYRGVGKTSFVNHAIDRITSELGQDETHRLIVIRLNLTKRLKPTQLMYHIIKTLNDELESIGANEQLPPKLRRRIIEAVQRTSFAIKRTTGIESEDTLGGEVGVAGYKVTGETKKKVTSGDELTYLEYDEQTAESDLIRIAKALAVGQAPSLLSWWQRLIGRLMRSKPSQIKFRVLFVFDELDKLDQDRAPGRPAALDSVFSSLKSLLTTSGMTFVFVGGRDMQERWEEDITRGDSVYQSVFSHHAYLPCLWDEAPRLCESFLRIDREGRPAALDRFSGYLRYAGRGIPRLAIDALKKYVDWDHQPLMLRLTPEDLRTISFFEELGEMLQREFMPPVEVRPGAAILVERDQQQLGAHYFSDWVIRRGHAEFTRADAHSAMLNLNPNIAPSERVSDALTERLLDLLARNQYIVPIGGRAGDLQIEDLQSRDLARFRLSPRRLAEMGGRAAPRAEEQGPASGPQFPPTVGGYQLQEQIGEGGMGIVFKARDPKRMRSAAVKLLKPAVRDNEIARLRFAREADVLKRLSHPGIVRFYDATTEGQWPFIAMEFVDGTPVSRLLKSSGAFSPDVAVGLVMEVARALEHVHGLGFVRNDIKPDNIFVMPDGHAKLIDFGISKHASHIPETTIVTVVGLFVGTPNYAAPEMWQGGAIDQRADVYALGVVLYQLVTGHLPFERDQREALMAAHLDDPPVPPSSHTEVPAELDAAILKALAKNPAHRFANMGDFCAALESVGAATPATVRKLVDESRQAALVAEGATIFAVADDLLAAKPRVAESARPAVPQRSVTLGPWLLLGDPGATRISLDLRRGENTVGRDPDCTITISSTSVSRFHMTVIWNDDGVFVKDTNSANGVFVNGKRIQELTKIVTGDRITIGDTDLELSFEEFART